MGVAHTHKKLSFLTSSPLHLHDVKMRRCEQDKEGAAFATEAVTKQQRKPDKVLLHEFPTQLHLREVKMRRCEQDKEGAAFATGAYIDVRDRATTQA